MKDNFNKWPLHDALLKKIVVLWDEKRCIAELEAFLDSVSKAIPCSIVWEGVTEVRIPHHEPWGAGLYVSRTEKEGDKSYILVMNSGDYIHIEAESADLTRHDTGSPLTR